MEPGGFHGWFQNIGDAVKFIQKEDIIPAKADKWVFLLAPYVVVMSTFLLYLVIPAGPDLVISDLKVGIFYVLGVGFIGVVGILMAGWASANKYSLMGSLRAVGQLIAYELPLVLAVVGVVIKAGSMGLNDIVHSQANFKIFGANLGGMPFIATQLLVGFVIFMIAAQAELTQPPFDMPVAESELVTGYMTEYSGFRFLSFFLGEAASAFALRPSPPRCSSAAGTCRCRSRSSENNLANVVGPGILFVKILAVVFIIFWVRFSYPRLCEDQLQTIA